MRTFHLRGVLIISDDTAQSPIPWGLVEHVNRTKTGRTTMQISLSIETRARLAQAAMDLGCSKLALIRTAISQFLLAHEETRRSGQERAYAATSEVPPPVPGREPQVADRPAVTTPEPEPIRVGSAPEPGTVPEPEPVIEPEQAPAPSRKPSRKKS